MLDAAVEKTLAQLAQPARPSARTERTVGDPIRTLRAVLAEKECALSPPPGRWAAQAPDTHHATLMYFVGLWALHGARAAGPNKKAVRSGEGGDRKRSSLLLAGCLSAAQVRRGQRRPGRRPTTQPFRLRRARSSCTSAPQVHGLRLQAVRPRPRRSLSSACERGRGVVPVGTMVVMSIRPPCTFRPRLRSSLLCKGK